MVSWNRVAPGLEGKQGSFRAIAYATVVVGMALLATLGVQWILFSRAAEAAEPSLVRKHGGALMICGGGRLPEEIRDTFIELAGGREARIVVIPTAHALADAPGVGVGPRPLAGERGGLVGPVAYTLAGRGQRPGVLPAAGGRHRGLDRRRQATALTSAYLGTEVERQLKAVLDRGGVIGGTSAGAAVMTRVMIASGRTEAVLSRGFDLLPGAVIDQHFLKRNRARRLLGVVASHRDLIGFGIDEGTTLVVSPRTGRVRVLGDSYVLACTADGATGGARFDFLKAGDETDLGGLRRPDGVIACPIDLEDPVGPGGGRNARRRSIGSIQTFEWTRTMTPAR